MFKKLLQWLQSFISRNKLQEAKPKRFNREEGKFSFLGITLSYINPTWKTLFLAIIFLISVIIIVFGLRESAVAFKTAPINSKEIPTIITGKDSASNNFLNE